MPSPFLSHTYFLWAWGCPGGGGFGGRTIWPAHNDNEPESERPEDAENGVHSIAEIEVDDKDNNNEKESESDENTFEAYLRNLTDAEENDEDGKNNSADLDDQPKKKKLKRMRVSSSEGEDN